MALPLDLARRIQSETPACRWSGPSGRRHYGAVSDQSSPVPWLIGIIGKSVSRQVFGRFGSLKSTVSTSSGRPAPTAFAIS